MCDEDRLHGNTECQVCEETDLIVASLRDQPVAEIEEQFCPAVASTYLA